MIRDKLVAICPSTKMKAAMLKEHNLTLQRAIEIWFTDTTVREQARIMGKVKTERENVLEFHNPQDGMEK